MGSVFTDLRRFAIRVCIFDTAYSEYSAYACSPVPFHSLLISEQLTPFVRYGVTSWEYTDGREAEKQNKQVLLLSTIYTMPCPSFFKNGRCFEQHRIFPPPPDELHTNR